MGRPAGLIPGRRPMRRCSSSEGAADAVSVRPATGSRGRARCRAARSRPLGAARSGARAAPVVRRGAAAATRRGARSPGSRSPGAHGKPPRPPRPHRRLLGRGRRGAVSAPRGRSLLVGLGVLGRQYRLHAGPTSMRGVRRHAGGPVRGVGSNGTQPMPARSTSRATRAGRGCCSRRCRWRPAPGAGTPRRPATGCRASAPSPPSRPRTARSSRGGPSGAEERHAGRRCRCRTDVSE